MPGSEHAVRNRKRNIKETEMKNMIGRAGEVSRLSLATKTQKGTNTVVEQQRIQKIPIQSLLGPAMQQLQRKRVGVGHSS